MREGGGERRGERVREKAEARRENGEFGDKAKRREREWNRS